MPGSDPARGPSIRTAALLLALAGCGDDGAPVAGTEASDSSGAEAVTGDSADALPTACVPGEARACYEGPFGTADIGRCRSGQQTCGGDGQAWSECTGEVWPGAEEICQTPEDDDCDGSSLCDPVVEWVLQPLPGVVGLLDVAPDGGVVATGYGYGESEELGLQLDDTFVLELSPEGEVRWDLSIVAAQTQQAHELRVDDAGQVTLVGRYEGTPDFGGGELPPAISFNAFAVRYDTDGHHLWSHGLSPSGYLDSEVGPDGTTYVVGSSISLQFEGEQLLGSFFVAAIDPGGVLEWVTVGSGSFVQSDWLEVELTGEGELAVMVVLAPAEQLELGGMPIVLDELEPVLLRLSTDGTPLGYQSLVDPAPVFTGRFYIHSRQSGVMTAAAVAVPIEGGGNGSRVLLAGFDQGLAPRPTHLIGSDVWLRTADAYDLGGTLLAVEFTGQLQLGPIGVSAPSFPSAQAVTVVDDQGQATWVEVLHSQDYAEIYAVASDADGAVIVAGEVGGQATLAGHTIVGSFIAKLRP